MRHPVMPRYLRGSTTPIHSGAGVARNFTSFAAATLLATAAQSDRDGWYELALCPDT